MSAPTRIAGKDLKLRVRDRSAIIIGIVAPLSLAFIFNLVFGNAFDPDEGIGLDYGIVDLDDSEITAAFVGVLEGAQDEGLLTITPFNEAASAEAAIDEGEIDAFYLLEQGFEAEVLANGSPTILVVGDIDAPTSTQIAGSIADQFSTGIEATSLAIGTSAVIEGVSLSPEFVAGLSSDPSSAAFSYRLIDAPAQTRQLDATTYYAAGMAIFFLFFTVQFGVLGLLEEEREGTLPRLMAAPIGRFAVVSGKAILAFVLGLISMGVMVVATQILMGAQWGAPLGVVTLVLAGVCAAVGIMGLVASVSRTPEGAGNLGAIIAVVLGMLGGVFFPLGNGDDLLSNLTYLTPQAWFMRGVADLADGAAWTAALPAAGAILLFAIVTGSLALVFVRRRLST
ncbi:MAG: ABC transporter permease [Acidimicrobiia bacterium]